MLTNVSSRNDVWTVCHDTERQRRVVTTPAWYSGVFGPKLGPRQGILIEVLVVFLGLFRQMPG
jgi:hypothetical protein